jgi:hypothetical protein
VEGIIYAANIYGKLLTVLKPPLSIQHLAFGIRAFGISFSNVHGVGGKMPPVQDGKMPSVQDGKMPSVQDGKMPSVQISAY